MTGLEVIYASIDVVNSQSDVGPKIKKSSSTKLLGVGTEIDSLMFVNLIVAIEEILFDEKGKSMDSESFSKNLEKTYHLGKKRILFIRNV